MFNEEDDDSEGVDDGEAEAEAALVPGEADAARDGEGADDVSSVGVGCDEGEGEGVGVREATGAGLDACVFASGVEGADCEGAGSDWGELDSGATLVALAWWRARWWSTMLFLANENRESWAKVSLVRVYKMLWVPKTMEKESAERATSEMIVMMRIVLIIEDGIVRNRLSFLDVFEEKEREKTGRKTPPVSTYRRGVNIHSNMVTCSQANKPNIVSAFRPFTPYLSSSHHPSTLSIASKFSTTLRHFPASSNGGKNGWSVPKSILDAPSFLPPPMVLPPCA